MKTNLLSKLTKNLALKIISIIIAIVIWYVVVDFNDPIETESYNVQVEVLNPTYVANGKEIYRIEDEYRSVTVYITANRSRLERIQANNIRVTADLTEIVDFSTDPVMVPLRVSCAGFSQSEMTISRTTIPIIIENVTSREFPIAASAGTTVPGSEYEVGTLTPNPDQVTISGPESIINQIDTVVAEVNVTGMVQNGTLSADLILYDENQVEISDATIEENLTFNGNATLDVEVDVELWRRQSGVTLDVNYSGTPADGYQVGTITTTPDEIAVVGSEEALAALAQQGNTITVPAEQVSVEGASSDLSVEVKLTELLPEDMRLATNTRETATVNVAILPDGSQEFELDVTNIETAGLASDLTVAYDQSELTLRIQADDGESLSALDMTRVTARIDLAGKDVGDYTVPVSITLPQGYRLVNDVSISVHLRERASASSESADSG